jgi:hypothetical protein
MFGVLFGVIHKQRWKIMENIKTQDTLPLRIGEISFSQGTILYCGLDKKALIHSS